MSDLNKRIESWKGHLLATESIRSSEVDEMSDHLHHELDRLSRSGLTDEEAFTVAQMRIGNPADIEAEYVKVNPGCVWSRRVMWMIAGYLVIHVWTRIIKEVFFPWASNFAAMAALKWWSAAVFFTALLVFVSSITLFLFYRLGTRGFKTYRYPWSRRRAVLALAYLMGIYALVVTASSLSYLYFLKLSLAGLMDVYSWDMPDTFTWQYWLYVWLPDITNLFPILLLGLIGVLAWRGVGRPVQD